MDLSDDELLNLPDDPELAFVQYEQALRKRVQEAIEASEGYGVESLQLEYINHVLAVVRALALDILPGWDVPPVSRGDYAIAAAYRQLLADTTHYTVQIRMKHARRVKRYSVALDAAAKQKIRHHLNKIKEVIDRLEVPAKKKERLFARVSDLEDEVNRDRTRLDAAMALVLEGAETGGEAGRRLEPLRKFIDSITGLLKAAQDQEEALPQVSGPEDRRRIESPRKALTPPRSDPSSANFEGSEDEIPF